MNPSAQRAFARAELLILLGFVVVVLALVLPARWAWRERRQLERVRADFQLVVSAIDRFFNAHHTWPSLYMGRARDVLYGQEVPNREVMNVLRARSGPGNPGHRLNPDRILYLEAGREGTAQSWSAEGDFLDPWLTPYQLVIDTDSDENCYAANTIYGMQPDQDLLIWSCGPDRRSGTTDDLLGWRRKRDGRHGRAL